MSEGRGVIAHQVQRNQQLLSTNAATLTRNLEDLEAQAKVCFLCVCALTLACCCRNVATGSMISIAIHRQ